jgi:hypothetical protein
VGIVRSLTQIMEFFFFYRPTYKRTPEFWVHNTEMNNLTT